MVIGAEKVMEDLTIIVKNYVKKILMNQLKNANNVIHQLIGLMNNVCIMTFA